MIALASTTGHARTLRASRTGAGEMMPCSMHFLMLSVVRDFAVRLRPRHAATSSYTWKRSTIRPVMSQQHRW